MRQVLHILRKDVRRHWPEIAISLLLMVAFGYYEVRSWEGVGNYALGAGFFAQEFWSGMVVFLTPIAWGLLLERIVHDESLVGDRQFWVTRPYEWHKLLGSKVLFVVLFIWVPLLVLQLFLLARAGFHPASYSNGLLSLQIMLLAALLPVAALAAATRTFVQLLLGLLIVVLYLIGTSWLSSTFHNSFSFHDATDQLSGLLFLATCIAVILLQYARRATTKSRSLIGSLGGAILLLTLASPYEFFLERTYPSLKSGESAPFNLGLLPPEKPADAALNEREQEVQIRLPLSTAAVPEDSIVELSGLRVSIAREDGARWDSGWKRMGAYLFPEEKRVDVNFAMKRDEFVRMRQSPVRMRVEFAYTFFRDGDRRQFVIPSGRFELTGMGWCSAEQEVFGRIRCLTPLRRPNFLLMTAEMVKGTCPLQEKATPAEPGEIARGWVIGTADGPAEVGISPVKLIDLYMSRSNGVEGWRGMGLCPGTPLTLSHPQVVGSNRTDVQFQAVELSSYRQPPIGLGQVSYGIHVR